jgi:hypothetical protein
MSAASLLWRRLDTPGHDACRVAEGAAGVEGVALFLEAGRVAQLSYRVSCDAGWRTRQGEVRGWLGQRPVGFRIERTETGLWRLDDEVVAGLEGCLDLDLGFTPATNLLQLRRLALAVGRAAEAPVAWLDVAGGSLSLLRQRYERRSQTTYWYEAPRFDYAALLEVGAEGFITRYPGLWEAEG